MPRGDKSKYTDKQKRKAEHIAEGYEDSGVSKKEPRAARGRPSTRNPAVARRAAADVARRKTVAHRAKVERRAARSDNGHGKTRSRKTERTDVADACSASAQTGHRSGARASPELPRAALQRR